MKIAVFGGTFDPVHNGHLTIAREAIEQMAFNRVLFVPAGLPYKKERKITSIAYRLAMLRIALGNDKKFVIDLTNANEGKPSYTFELIEALKKKYPRGTEFHLLIGTDNLLQFPEWLCPEQVLKMCRLAVFPRQVGETVNMDELEKKVKGITFATSFLNYPPAEISSTMVRNRVVRGEDISTLVPHDVREYIKYRKLYGGEGTHVSLFM